MHSDEPRVVLVTGAGSGIGETTAEAFAARQARVGVLDVSAEAAARVADRIQAEGGTAIAIPADVSNAAMMHDAVTDLVARWGRLDVLINNAACQIMGPVHTFSEADFDRIVAVNLKGVFLGCRAALPVMMAQRRGVILSTSSVLGLTGDPDLAVYGATKGAILAFTQALAVAYGPYGIRAVAVCPGDVETPLVQDYFRHQPDPDASRRFVVQQYPMGRIGNPKDIAETLVFLASEAAGFISGGHVLIDGGLSARVY